MLNFPTLIVGLYVFIFVLGVLILIKAFPSRQRVEVRWLLLFTATIAIISFCSLNVYVQDVLANKALFSRLRLLGFSIAGQAWFFFIFHTYGRRRFFHQWWVIAASFAPAAVTWTLLLVPGWQDLVTLNYETFPWRGVALVTFENGPWWKFHMIWCHLFMWLGVFYTLYLIPKLNRAKRNQLILLSLGGFVAVGVDLLAVTSFPSLRWAMLSGGTTVLTEIAILYSIMKHGLLDLSLIAKDHIFQKIPDPVLILDEKNRLSDFNGSAERFFRLTPSHKRRAFDEIAGLKGMDPLRLPSEARLSSEGLEPRSFQLIIEPLDPEAPFGDRVVLFRDISAQKTMERSLNDNLEFKARLLAMIAHDFSGVMESQTALSSALERQSGGDTKSLAQNLVHSTSTSKDFLTNVLLWAKSQENKFQPQVQPLELNMLIQDVLHELESTLRLHDLEAVVRSERDPILMKGDDVMLESVVRNLLKNAIRASKPGQTIDILIREKQLDQVQVTIQDKGVGMSPKQLESLQRSSADLFVSDPETRPLGFGIGLAIARRFVELHRGSLAFESEQGRGTSVTLTLPI
ncbi:MAG: hypothetical protein KF681_04910 [Bdellovibrionaceae bacterium]|nr:hypothetical protein [Pseudobdellovibrionaceae bacterium]